MLKRLNSNKLTMLFSLFLIGANACAEDISSVLNLAIEVDTTLRQALETKLATTELLPQARADLLPVLSGNANTSYNNTNNPNLLRYNTYTYGAAISQPIINMTSWYQYQQADYNIKSAIANYEDAKQDLIIRVTEQYFNILKAADDLKFAQAERKAFARHVAETQQKFKAGVIAITDVNEAQAKYDSAVAQEISAENELFNQKEIMGEITGVPAKNPNFLKPNIHLQKPKPDIMDHWVKLAVDQNFALQSKRWDMQAAKKNIDIQWSGHLPTLQADASTSKSKSVPPGPVIANTNAVGVTFTLPLFNAGKVNSQTRQAAHQYEIARQQAIDIERKVVSQVRQAYRGISTQISQIKALQQSVISGKSALDATQAAFEVGTRTIVDVLNAQSDLLRARNDLSKARYDYILESFRLKRFTGILQIHDVNIVNAWLQPETKLEAAEMQSAS